MTGNKAEDFGGKAKEAAGKVTGNERLESEGKTDQAKASVKDVADDTIGKAKDALGGIKDSLTGSDKKKP